MNRLALQMCLLHAGNRNRHIGLENRGRIAIAARRCPLKDFFQTFFKITPSVSFQIRSRAEKIEPIPEVGPIVVASPLLPRKRHLIDRSLDFWTPIRQRLLLPIACPTPAPGPFSQTPPLPPPPLYGAVAPRSGGTGPAFGSHVPRERVEQAENGQALTY